MSSFWKLLKRFTPNDSYENTTSIKSFYELYNCWRNITYFDGKFMAFIDIKAKQITNEGTYKNNYKLRFYNYTNDSATLLSHFRRNYISKENIQNLRICVVSIPDDAYVIARDFNDEFSKYLEPDKYTITDMSEIFTEPKINEFLIKTNISSIRKIPVKYMTDELYELAKLKIMERDMIDEFDEMLYKRARYQSEKDYKKQKDTEDNEDKRILESIRTYGIIFPKPKKKYRFFLSKTDE
jgi:hypothetical protein